MSPLPFRKVVKAICAPSGDHAGASLPTSSVDSRTEAVILDALDRLMKGRTTFMIAHRLSTIRHADLILVMQHGAIVQRGKHDELIAVDGLYKQLFELQTAQRERRSFLPAAATEMAETTT